MESLFHRRQLAIAMLDERLRVTSRLFVGNLQSAVNCPAGVR